MNNTSSKSVKISLNVSFISVPQLSSIKLITIAQTGSHGTLEMVEFRLLCYAESRRRPITMHKCCSITIERNWMDIIYSEKWSKGISGKADNLPMICLRFWCWRQKRFMHLQQPKWSTYRRIDVFQLTTKEQWTEDSFSNKYGTIIAIYISQDSRCMEILPRLINIWNEFLEGI